MMVSEKCKFCGSRTTKGGVVNSDFHSVYTHHKLKVPRRLYCNKSCGKKSGDTIHSIFGSNMHPDLVEKQVKTGATNSFMESQKSLELENGRYRKINNQLNEHFRMIPKHKEDQPGDKRKADETPAIS